MDVFWKHWSASSEGKLRACQGGVAPGEPEHAGRDGTKQASGYLKINPKLGNGTNAVVPGQGGFLCATSMFSPHAGHEEDPILRTPLDLSLEGHVNPGPAWKAQVRAAASDLHPLGPSSSIEAQHSWAVLASFQGSRSPIWQDQALICPNPCAHRDCAGLPGGRSSVGAGGRGWCVSPGDTATTLACLRQPCAPCLAHQQSTDPS